MYKLLNEPYETSAFKWLKLDWTYGLGKIFTQQEIDKIKNSRSFEREYNLKFSGLEVTYYQKVQYNVALLLERNSRRLHHWTIGVFLLIM